MNKTLINVACTTLTAASVCGILYFGSGYIADKKAEFQEREAERKAAKAEEERRQRQFLEDKANYLNEKRYSDVIMTITISNSDLTQEERIDAYAILGDILESVKNSYSMENLHEREANLLRFIAVSDNADAFKAMISYEKSVIKQKEEKKRAEKERELELARLKHEEELHQQELDFKLRSSKMAKEMIADLIKVAKNNQNINIENVLSTKSNNAN